MKLRKISQGGSTGLGIKQTTHKQQEELKTEGRIEQKHGARYRSFM